MIRLRSLRDGQVVNLPDDMTVEITDQQGNIALLIAPEPQQNAVTLITAADEPLRADNYERTFGVTFSRLLAPDLNKLAPAPAPQPFSRH